jgi:hypothetical protein
MIGRLERLLPGRSEQRGNTGEKVFRSSRRDKHTLDGPPASIVSCMNPYSQTRAGKDGSARSRTMSALPVKEWSFAERDPIQPTWFSHQTFKHLVDILCAVSKPVLITVYSVRYYLLGPPISRWSLSNYLLTRLDRFRMGLSQLGPLSPPQIGPFEVPPGTDRHGVEVTPIRLASVPEQEAVLPCRRWRFRGSCLPLPERWVGGWRRRKRVRRW